jgi:7-cyano-7-deazaguanine synthase
MGKNNVAVAILSGGLDSTVAVQMALSQGLHIAGAITFVYGQRHSRELYHAKAVAGVYGLTGLRHLVVEIPPALMRGSALTSGGGDVPENRTPEQMMHGIAPTYVPNRNMVMLAMAGSFAWQHDADTLIGGWHWDDSSGYPRQ